MYHKIAVPCDLRQKSSGVRETDFKILKCIADLISTIVEQSERSGPLVKKSNSGEVGGGAGRKTRWNYVEFRNQIDTEADDE